MVAIVIRGAADARPMSRSAPHKHGSNTMGHRVWARGRKEKNRKGAQPDTMAVLFFTKKTLMNIFF